MKKITTIMMILGVSLGYAQTFPLDFSDPLDAMTGENGAVFQIVQDAGDDVGSLAGSGELFDFALLALAQNLDLSDDNNNTITFRVKPMADYGTRTHLLKFENGTTPNTELTFTTTGADWQNVSIDYGAGLGNYGLMVLFPDFNNNEVGTYLFDDFAGATNLSPPTGLTSAPTPPNRPAADVKSIFSDSYAPIAVLNYQGVDGQPSNDNTFNTSWCPANTTLVQIEGNNTNLVTGLGCEGVSFLSGRFDASDFTNFHIDIYTDSPTMDKSFNIKFSNWNNGAGEANAIEFSFTNGSNPPLPSTNPGSWISFDVPFSAFTPITNADRNDLTQFVITSNLGTVYYDNLYVHKNTLGLNEFDAVSFNVFPNPSKDSWTLKTNNIEMTSIQLFDVVGKNVLTLTPKSNEAVIDGATLNTGLYFARITTNGNVNTVKLIKD